MFFLSLMHFFYVWKKLSMRKLKGPSHRLMASAKTLVLDPYVSCGLRCKVTLHKVSLLVTLPLL